MVNEHLDNCFTRGLVLGGLGKIPHVINDISYIVEGSIKEIIEQDYKSHGSVGPQKILDDSFSRGYLKGLERYVEQRGIRTDKKIFSDTSNLAYICAGYNNESIIGRNSDIKKEAYSLGMLLSELK